MSLLKNVVLCFILTSLAATAMAKSETFPQFIKQIKKEAIAKGISPKVVAESLDHVTQLQRIIVKDKHQTQHTMTFATYRRSFVSPDRLQQGKVKQQQNKALIDEISKKYHVPSQIILALWGLESNYGETLGKYPEFSALATLAYNKRRRHFFSQELFAAMEIVDRKLAPVDQLKGSWAGAMGQCQFMPRTYLAYAVDYDKNGKIDIWHNKKDVLASIANYIHALGWEGRHALVIPVHTNKSIPSWRLGLHHTATLKSWVARGVIIPKRDMQGNQQTYSLTQPDKNLWYLVETNDFKVIMRWNHAYYYALSIGLLAREINS